MRNYCVGGSRQMKYNVENIFTHYIDVNMIMRFMSIDDTKRFVVVDGGASKGMFIGALFERFKNEVGINQRFEIHAFEPAKTNFEVLNSKYNSTQYPQIHNYEMALVGNESAETEMFTFFETNNNQHYEWGNIKGLYRDYFQPTAVNKHQYPVKTLKVDDMLGFIGVDKIDYFKMDIEGCEFDIIKTITPESAKKN